MISGQQIREILCFLEKCGLGAEHYIPHIPLSKCYLRAFPGGPMVRTPYFHCKGHGLDPWLGNRTPHSEAKNKNF